MCKVWIQPVIVPHALLMFALPSCLISVAKCIFSPTKCSHQKKKKSKICFSDWPALDIDFSNTISPQRGGRKQSWAASSFRHVLLTLAGLLGGGGSSFLHAPQTTGLILCTGGSQRSVDTVNGEPDFTPQFTVGWFLWRIYIRGWSCIFLLINNSPC